MNFKKFLYSNFLGIKVKYLLAVSIFTNIFLVLFAINKRVAFGLFVYCAFVYVIAGLIAVISGDVL